MTSRRDFQQSAVDQPTFKRIQTFSSQSECLTEKSVRPMSPFTFVSTLDFNLSTRLVVLRNISFAIP